MKAIEVYVKLQLVGYVIAAVVGAVLGLGCLGVAVFGKSDSKNERLQFGLVGALLVIFAGSVLFIIYR